MKFESRIFGLLALPAVALLMLLAAEYRPGYFNNVTYLGGVLLLEVVAVAVWHYDNWFFLIMMLTFLWAGVDIPLAGGGSTVRWVFLAVGALVGLIKWAGSDRRKRLGGLHLVAFLCVLMAVVSSMVSNRTQTSLLKSSSLFLLFLYASCGVRVALVNREPRFFRGLLMACEIITYLSGLAYVVLHSEVFGNSNSLGAVMGVVVVPVLLWGVLIAEQPNVRQRRTIALCLASYLLISSVSRAALLGCGLAVVVMCVSLHRQKVLIKAGFLLIFLAAIIAVMQPGQFDAMVSGLWEDVVYKGKPEQGLLGSRRSPWQETMDVIKESPWFGSGFGTDVGPVQGSDAGSVFRTAGGTSKEHGNSYLALLEYVGLLGIVPFAILVFLALRMVFRVCLWIWKTADPRPYAVPLAAICLAGLVHAFFEDWLFAVGYYLSTFFWASVFILSDLQPSTLRTQLSFNGVWNRRPVPASQVPLSANPLSSNQ
jgi:O-antigen ligase